MNLSEILSKLRFEGNKLNSWNCVDTNVESVSDLMASNDSQDFKIIFKLKDNDKESNVKTNDNISLIAKKCACDVIEWCYGVNARQDKNGATHLIYNTIEDCQKKTIEKAWEWIEAACGKYPIHPDELPLLKHSFKRAMSN